MNTLARTSLVALALATPAFASSDLLGRLSDTDRERLAARDAVRAEAIRVADTEGEAGDRAELQAMLAGPPQTILGDDIRGDYRCRTAKLDGILPLIVYGWFACRIEEDDIGYRLVKLTGSQRLAGHFIDDGEDRLIFYGAAHYADEAPASYDPAGDRNVVGYFIKMGEGHYRLEQPLPATESRFDILELQRR